MRARVPAASMGDLSSAQERAASESRITSRGEAAVRKKVGLVTAMLVCLLHAAFTLPYTALGIGLGAGYGVWRTGDLGL